MPRLEHGIKATTWEQSVAEGQKNNPGFQFEQGNKQISNEKHLFGVYFNKENIYLYCMESVEIFFFIFKQMGRQKMPALPGKNKRIERI